ncbi:ATP-binding protein [Streptomyces sp. NPDC050161]|uniref:ATP-binding protein n=1 Tax=Streptomyces sp. NPDC050161 TaxID=3365604 RepID=UPI0037BAE05F
MHQLATDDHTARSALPVCRPGTAADARDFAAGFVAALTPELPATTVQNLLLLVSELVANALRHAGAVTALHLTADLDSILVGVEDPSPAHPQERRPDLTGRTGGFGWPMVRSLARDITIRPHPCGGKILLATLAR